MFIEKEMDADTLHTVEEQTGHALTLDTKQPNAAGRKGRVNSQGMTRSSLTPFFSDPVLL